MNDIATESTEQTEAKKGLAKSTKKLFEGYPEEFCVIDVDISAEDALLLHEGDEIAQALIKAAVQLRRNSAAVTPAWVSRLMSGVKEPVLYVAITDIEGTERALVLSGNMRTLGLRAANDRREKAEPSKPRLKMRGIPQTQLLSGDPKDIYHRALSLKADANVRVPLTVTAKAELAVQLNADGSAAEDIAIECEVPAGQVDDLLTIGELMATRKLSNKMLAAIDEGRFGAQAARMYSKLSPAEQDARLESKGGGRGEGGEKRPKAPPALFIIDAHKAAKRCGVGDEAVAVLEFLRADSPEKRIALAKKWPALGKAFADGGFDIGTGRIKK